MPLGILTVVVLAVILFGITTATESAGVGAAGAFLLAIQARTLDWKRTKEAVFLTAKTTAMASVVTSRPATEPASCRAVRTTLAGSTMPASIMRNADVIDLYERVKVGTKVVVM